VQIGIFSSYTNDFLFIARGFFPERRKRERESSVAPSAENTKQPVSYL